MIKRTFLGFLQQLYGSIEPGYYRWDSNLQVTEIVITDETPVNLEVVGKRPAITTVRGPVAYAGLTLGTRQPSSLLEAKKKYTDLASCTLTLNHLASVDTASEYVATVTARHLWWLKNLIKRGTLIHEIQQPQIGSPSPAGALVQGDSQGTWRNTTVAIPVFFQDYGVVERTGLPTYNGIDVRSTPVHRDLGPAPVRDLYRDGATLPERHTAPAVRSIDVNTIKVR